MCELLVGLPEVDVLGVAQSVDGIVRVEIQIRGLRSGCAECGVFAWVKDRPVVELVDLPAFGVAYGTALVDDDPDRYATVNALGLDETLFVKLGPRHRQHFSTSIVDVERGQLLDIVDSRGGRNSWLLQVLNKSVIFALRC